MLREENDAVVERFLRERPDFVLMPLKEIWGKVRAAEVGDGNFLRLLPHVHDTDEIIGFFGSNPDDPYDLGGEVEIWLEDDKHMLTRSCMIFVPAGMKHCPLTVTRVDRPIFHFTTVTGHEYDRVSAAEAPGASDKGEA